MNKVSVKGCILDDRNNLFFQFYILPETWFLFHDQASVKKQNIREASRLTIGSLLYGLVVNCFQLVLTADKIDKIASCIFNSFVHFPRFHFQSLFERCE